MTQKGSVLKLVLEYLDSFQDYDGEFVFTIKEMMQTLGLNSSQYSTAYKILNKAVEFGKVEKINSRDYRIIKHTTPTSFQDMLKPELKIPLPFGIGYKCLLFPSDIILIYASYGQGKSYFAINIALFYLQRGLPVHYYYSECKENIAYRFAKLVDVEQMIEWEEQGKIRFIPITDPFMKPLAISKNSILIWDWADLTGRYDRVNKFIRKLQEGHRSLIFLFWQAKEEYGKLKPYGRESSLQRPAYGFEILYDGEDKKKEYPILQFTKVRQSEFYTEGKEIYLKFEENGRLVHLEDCHHRGQLKEILRNEGEESEELF